MGPLNVGTRLVHMLGAGAYTFCSIDVVVDFLVQLSAETAAFYCCHDIRITLEKRYYCMGGGIVLGYWCLGGVSEVSRRCQLVSIELI